MKTITLVEDKFELFNKKEYLIQSNFFTRSVFNLEKDIHKDIVYLIQSKIDYFGEPKDSIKISFNDYLNYKSIKKNDTYSFKEFSAFAKEIINIGGAFYNKINNRFISFNIVDNVQIDVDNAESLNINLAKFAKIFFYRDELNNYIKSITPQGNKLKYAGHTQIESSVFTIKGIRRKKFFEIISQFKNTGYCKISFQELKMYLGYIEIIDKNSQKILSKDEQLKLVFIPQNDYELKDSCPRFSVFERDFLVKAIDNINNDSSKDINNLKIAKKIKSGRSITHIEFTFNALGKDLTDEEQKAVALFTDYGLDFQQIVYLLRRIGFKEMYGRIMKHVKIQNDDNGKKQFFIRKENSEVGQRIENLSGYFYKVLYPELQKS